MPINQWSTITKNGKKNQIPTITETCQKIKNLWSQKMPKHQFSAVKQMPKNQKFLVTKMTKIKGHSYKKMPKNQTSMVTEKCHKIIGLQSY